MMLPRIEHHTVRHSGKDMDDRIWDDRIWDDRIWDDRIWIVLFCLPNDLRDLLC